MLTSDNRTLAIDLLTLALDQLKSSAVSIDELTINNLKLFINVNLHQHSNSATDAKCAVALEVRLGISKKCTNAFFIQIIN